jgi:hypothetical protein
MAEILCFIKSGIVCFSITKDFSKLLSAICIYPI